MTRASVRPEGATERWNWHEIGFDVRAINDLRFGDLQFGDLQFGAMPAPASAA
ncbi:MAG: hypothetical protein U0572_13285 [Phycisphaerales bacterium]